MAQRNIMIFCRFRQANISHPRCLSTARIKNRWCTSGLTGSHLLMDFRFSPIRGRHQLLTFLHSDAIKLHIPNPHFRIPKRNVIHLLNLILGHFSYWDLITFFWLKGIAMSLSFFWLSQLSTSVARFSKTKKMWNQNTSAHIDPLLIYKNWNYWNFWRVVNYEKNST